MSSETRGVWSGEVSVARCLRCGAGAEFIQGNPPRMPRDEEVARLRAALEASEARVRELERAMHDVVDWTDEGSTKKRLERALAGEVR